MQADYRSLKIGAIASASQSSGTATNYNWSVAKSQETLSLLSARHEGGGLCYIIMELYTTAQEKKLYPTSFDKSSDGAITVERDAADIRQLLEWLPNAANRRDQRALLNRAQSLMIELESAMNELNQLE